jgi:UDP-2,3-diacylglucosamine hydrolase
VTSPPTTAIIAGRGGLPAALVASMGADVPLVAALDGFVPDGLAVDIAFRIERLVPFMRALQDRGVTRLIFAGAASRPRLDPSLIDAQTAQILPQLMAAMAQGDDATLRAVIALFEEAGFAVVGVADVAPGLIPNAGLLAGALTAADEADAMRAAAIVAALGSVDVGQGAVVQQGLCLGLEALPGTDALLDAVAQMQADSRPDAAKGRGLFYKATKPGQDRRIDLPTIGIETLIRVAAAGLGGIAWQAGGVICLDRAGMVDFAHAQGMFLWSR